jgi:hypothetical protein
VFPAFASAALSDACRRFPSSRSSPPHVAR